MAESESPASLQKPTSHPLSPSATTLDDRADCFLSSVLQHRPKIRVTSEYDSDSSVFFHMISCKLLDNLAKLKFAFQNDGKREIFEPRLGFVSKYLSLDYYFEEGNIFVNSAIDVRPGLQFKASHDVKAQQGEVAMVADLLVPAVNLELALAVPSVAMPKATLKFPFGEVSLKERNLVEEEEAKRKRIVSLSGILNAPVLDGMCFAHYNDEYLSLRYSYKDEQMTFIPTLTLPSNSLAFSFKRQFSHSDKLSYWYNFDSNHWSTVYKHTVGKDFKLKAGYDSEVRLGWASLWVGDEDGKAKTSPMKMKVQFMLQVPQDDIKSSALIFRVKKRWDI